LNFLGRQVIAHFHKADTETDASAGDEESNRSARHAAIPKLGSAITLPTGIDG
jgi:hypothetical protein